MSIQSSFYSTDGKTKTYPSTKHIATKQHMAVWLREISGSLDIQLNVNEYELITNAAVLTSAPDPKIYDRIEVRVADNADELTDSPSDIGIVADIADEVVIVAGIAPDVTGVAAIASDVVAVNTEPLRQSIVDADGNATDARNSAAAALVSENNAKASENSAKTSEANAEYSYQNSLVVEANIVTEGDTQIARVHAEGDASVTRVTSEGNLQVNRVTNTGTTEMNKLKAYVPVGTANSVDESIRLDELQNDANFNAYGLTERVDSRYLETDTPNLLTDQVGDSVRLSDGMIDRATLLTTTMPLVPFDPSSTDEIIAIANTTITQVNHTKGDIVVTEDGDNVYQATEDTTAGEDTTGAKFQAIPDVTRQDVIAISKTGYKTYKGLAYHDELVSTDDIATSQGFSKLDNGLYSDGVDDITIVGLRSALNAGAYHPVYNSFGSDWSIPTAGGVATKWYDSSIDHTSTYHTIKYDRGSVSSGSGSISSGVSGRPDSRYYDKVYSDGYGGVIPVATYTDSCIDLDVEATKLLSSGGLEGKQELLSDSTHLQVDDETDTAKTVWTMTQKANIAHEVLVTADSGVTWTVASHTYDAIANTVTIASATQVKISYTSQNKPLAETTPLPVIKVLPKAVASNSHSIYKGAMVTNAITGKVAVGDSVNGLESRLLENAEAGCDYVVEIGVIIGLVQNQTIVYVNSDIFTLASSGGGYYSYIGDSYDYTPSVGNDFPAASWNYLGYLTTTPSHNTITLNADTSPASKWFVSEVEFANGEIGVGVFGEDTSTDKSGTTFDTLTPMFAVRTGVFK